MPERAKTSTGPLSGKKIAFIGAGFMGGAIIRSLISKGVAPSFITAYDPSAGIMEALGAIGVAAAKSPEAAARGADLILLAVKPQLMAKVAPSLKKTLTKKSLVISIAAGVPTSRIEGWLGRGAKVARAMPNMAAQVGQSATALCPGAAAGADDMNMAKALFGAAGTVVEVDETLMDAVTGLSGSGPAYVFMFLEGLIDAGVRCGLSREASAGLARQTLLGAAMMASQSGEHPAILKERITSPGGTTIAALSSLEEDGFKGSIINAVMAAVARSRELGAK